jgi:putative ATP-binding cassette transporter
LRKIKAILSLSPSDHIFREKPILLNLQLLRKFSKIAQPYWFSSEKWGAITLFAGLIFSSLIGTALLLLLSIFLGELTSALTAQDSQRFLQGILVFLGIIIIGVPLLSYKVYLQASLSLYWRRWLTDYFLDQYFHNQQFYQMTFAPNIDNPDQRIAEDVKTFTQQSLNFVIILLDAILQLIGFTGLLWSISPLLMSFLIIYAVGGTIITTVVFGRILIGINLEQLKREANFRFGLVRIRENAEAIAFYQGQETEKDQVKQRFSQVFANFQHLIRWQLNLNLFQNSYQYITFILPGLILAPRILSGELEIGEFSKASVAFRSILIALALLINQFDELSAFAAGITRLDTLQRFVTSPPSSHTTLERIEDNYFALENVTLQTPDYQTILVRDLSLTVPSGQGLLIIGESGVGKSSLLRGLAGLWHSGSGTIRHPKQEQMLFLPQRPYLILGSLRQQLSYPNLKQDIAEDSFLNVLKIVNLSTLISRFGGLEAIEDWTTVLSLGEQQRLSFARLLLNQPQYAILDEATSALDPENEALLYQHLQKTRITFISVGHRSSLLEYHQQVLELTGQGKWQLQRS